MLMPKRREASEIETRTEAEDSDMPINCVFLSILSTIAWTKQGIQGFRLDTDQRLGYDLPTLVVYSQAALFVSDGAGILCWWGISAGQSASFGPARQ